jgi:hypothetical protein
MVSGTAQIIEEGAVEHINMLAKKYLGEDKYPYLGPSERRVIIQIHPERVDGFGPGAIASARTTKGREARSLRGHPGTLAQTSGLATWSRAGDRSSLSSC